MTICPLEPLTRESCLSCLDNFADRIPAAARDIVFDWTHGYPLAMEAMTNAILSKRLDPEKEPDQRQLLQILREKVIEEKIFGSASPSERTRLQTLLALLSVPRRFNLILTQDLVEKFAAQYQLENSLAYITLPRAINEVTSVLYWSMERAAYCIDTPVRNLFLLQYRIEQPEQFVKIHKFLAEKNEDFLRQVAGSDRIRYLREFFYHLAYSEDSAQVQRILSQKIEQLAQVQQDERSLLQSLESFLQFYEEFQQDEELKEALGQRNASFALSLVYRNFIEIYRQLPETMRGNWLKDFFSLITQQPENDDFSLIFEQAMRQIIKQVSRDEAIKLYNELIQDEELKVLLGVNFDEARTHILAELF